MITISITYHNAEGASFDFDYYRRTHLPMIGEKLGAFGLVSASVLKGMEGMDGGDPPVVATCFLTFSTFEGAQGALTSEACGELVADIANFTTIQPEIQFNTPVR